MSNDLIIAQVATAYASGDTAGQAKVVAVRAPPAQPQPVTATSPGPNPSLQLNPQLGLVVIEFRNDAGDVTTSIPSERQLQAYQRWQTTQLGPAPHGMHVDQTQPPQTKRTSGK